MENVINTTKHKLLDAMIVHKELHTNKEGFVIKLNNREYKTYISRNGCKAVNIDGDVFMEQNKFKTGRWADLANQGHMVTWIIPSDGSQWGRIVDDECEILI